MENLCIALYKQRTHSVSEYKPSVSRDTYYYIVHINIQVYSPVMMTSLPEAVF